MVVYEPGNTRGHHRRYPAVHARSASRFGRGTSSHDALRLDICRALHLWPVEVVLEDESGLDDVIGKLRRALRRQRGHAIAGHWSYELASHARLLDLFRQVKALRRCFSKPKTH